MRIHEPAGEHGAGGSRVWSGSSSRSRDRGRDPVGSVGGEELGLRVTIAAEDDVEAYRTVRDLYLGAFRAVFGFSPEIGEREVLLQEKFDEREER